MDELPALLGDRLLDRGVRIAERVDADAAEQVEVLVAVLVFEIDAFAADEEERVAFVGGQQELGFGGLESSSSSIAGLFMPPSPRFRGLCARCKGRAAGRLRLRAGCERV